MTLSCFTTCYLFQVLRWFDCHPFSSPVNTQMLVGYSGSTALARGCVKTQLTSQHAVGMPYWRDTAWQSCRICSKALLIYLKDTQKSLVQNRQFFLFSFHIPGSTLAIQNLPAFTLRRFNNVDLVPLNTSTVESVLILSNLDLLQDS